MGIPLATLASRPGRRAAATLALLLLLSGCEAAAGTADQPVEGLLILTTADATSLDVLAAKRTRTRPSPSGCRCRTGTRPGSRPGRTGVLVGSTADGTLVTSDPVDPRGSAVDIAGLEWRPVKATDEAGESLPAGVVPDLGSRGRRDSPRSAATCRSAGTSRCSWSTRTEAR